MATQKMRLLITLLLSCVSTALITHRTRSSEKFMKNSLAQRLHRIHATLADEAPADTTEVEGEDVESAEAAITITPSSPSEILLPQMSSDADDEKSTALARRVALDGLTSALTRTLDRSTKATGMLSEEIEMIRSLLEVEVATENRREGEIKRLRSKLEAVIEEKEATIIKEKETLQGLQKIAGEIIEAPIRKNVEDAINTKADLVSIEAMLMEVMIECKVELDDVMAACIERRDTFKNTLSSMISEDSASSLDEWENIANLQEFFLKMNTAVSEGVSKMNELRSKISTAMEQRNVLLGRVDSNK